MVPPIWDVSESRPTPMKLRIPAGRLNPGFDFDDCDSDSGNEQDCLGEGCSGICGDLGYLLTTNQTVRKRSHIALSLHCGGVAAVGQKSGSRSWLVSQ